jgi:hypothetical protein
MALVGIRIDDLDFTVLHINEPIDRLTRAREEGASRVGGDCACRAQGFHVRRSQRGALHLP